MNNFLLAVLITCSTLIKAQTILLEENFTSGIPVTWTLINSDNLTPHSSVAQFTQAWIGFETPVDTCAASTSYYNPAGQSADYLITPKLQLETYSKLVWSARSYDASFPDSYVVLISTTDSLIGSFTDTLAIVEDEHVYWITRSVQLNEKGFENQSVFIAFKNITNDGFILMLDDIKVSVSDHASIDEAQVKNEYLIYPNPATEFITITNFQEGNLVYVFSTDGKLLLESSKSTIPVDNLASGMYFVKIQSSLGIYSFPFIKQ